jgi:hypothetical protein
MLFRETVAVYCENHTEHTNVRRIQSSVFNVKVGSTYICQSNTILEQNFMRNTKCYPCARQYNEDKDLLTYLRSWALPEKLSIVQPLRNFPAF